MEFLAALAAAATIMTWALVAFNRMRTRSLAGARLNRFADRKPLAEAVGEFSQPFLIPARWAIPSRFPSRYAISSSRPVAAIAFLLSAG